MRIREYTPADFDALRRMHAAQGFGYPLPDLDSPLFVSKLVLEDDAEDCDLVNDAGADPSEGDRSMSSREARDGEDAGREEARGDSLPERSSGARPKRIAMAVLLRLTAEAYLLHDPAAGTPRLRWQRLLALHEAARKSARRARPRRCAGVSAAARFARFWSAAVAAGLDARSVGLLFAAGLKRATVCGEIFVA